MNVDSISMDFVTALPRTRSGNDIIWVIVDILTKSTVLFISIKETWKKKQLAKMYIRHVVRLHGVPRDINSNRDSRNLSKFWEKVQLNLGTMLKMRAAFHPVTDGHTERTNQTMEYMLRVRAVDFQGSWED